MPEAVGKAGLNDEAALRCLADLPVGTRAIIARIPLDDPGTAAELAALRILPGEPVDVLTDGNNVYHLPGVRLAAPNHHGSGCLLASAAAAGLAQGGAVDGYVWETLQRSHPQLTARTRVVAQSPEFGFPPFVARSTLSDGDFAALRQALIDMRGNDEGRKLLRQLNLDLGFGGPGAAGEYLQDQFGAVNYLEADRQVEVVHLDRR